MATFKEKTDGKGIQLTTFTLAIAESDLTEGPSFRVSAYSGKYPVP